MKPIFSNTGKSLKAVLFAAALSATLLLGACGGDDTDPDCTGCTAASPWSKPGASGCYASQADCERNEGGTCVICN